jgi:hypothetical protein
MQMDVLTSLFRGRSPRVMLGADRPRSEALVGTLSDENEATTQMGMFHLPFH